MNPFGNKDEGWRGWGYWLRNPAHNLFMHMLRRLVVDPVYVLGESHPYTDELRKDVVLRFRPFFLKVGLFFIGWRSDKPIAEWGGGIQGGAFDVGVKRLG